MDDLGKSIEYILDKKICDIIKLNAVIEYLETTFKTYDGEVQGKIIELAKWYTSIYNLNIHFANFNEIRENEKIELSHNMFTISTISTFDTKSTFDAPKRKSLLDVFNNNPDDILRSKDVIKELDLEKSEKGFYLDSFGDKISYDGNIELKKRGTKIDMTFGRLFELTCCKLSFTYFRLNYTVILTKTGPNNPEMRSYQYRIERSILKNNYNVILAPRQAGKTVSVVLYLLWEALFTSNINIGICANKAATAREVLRKLAQVFVNLPMWLKTGVEIWNKSNILFENGTRILTDATTVDSFRGYTINILFIDELGFITPIDKWKEFADSVLPSQSSLPNHKRIFTSTMNGYNHWWQLVDGARKKINGYNLVEVFWNEPPGRDEKFKDSIIAAEGIQHWLQNYENSPLGSANTFIPMDTLKKINDMKRNPKCLNKYINDGKLFEYPKENHRYIISCDSAKNGNDKFGIHVIDVTTFPWRQVYSANLSVNYLIMAKYIFNLATSYNNGFVIIENNEGSGQSINDTLWNTYEYENLYRDIDENGKFKKYYGFRTTSKSRKQILSLLLIFLENNFLEVYDENTIEELFNFVERNGKYQADEGHHDDLVMSLALTFAPLKNTRGFDNQAKLIDKLFKDQSTEESSFEEIFTFGNFDIPEENEETENIIYFYNGGNDYEEYKENYFL